MSQGQWESGWNKNRLSHYSVTEHSEQVCLKAQNTMLKCYMAETSYQPILYTVYAVSQNIIVYIDILDL